PERKLIRRFEQLLRNHLHPAEQGGQEMSVALDKARDIWLDWFQPWSFSALCSFRAGEEPFWTLVFLPGYYRPMEEATLQALELLLAARRGRPVTTELRRLEERPVVAVTAWRRPPMAVDQHGAVQ